MSSTTRQITLHDFGVPAEAVEIRSIELPSAEAGQVVVDVHYAPINPADLNIIEGTYGNRPELPAVLGMEGVGIVRETGSGVTGFQACDTVIFLDTLGTWSQSIICTPSQLHLIPSGISLDQASMLKVNPPTAWRMLHDFVDLEAGDWIAQNAANSAVGRCVIQIAKAKDIRTINVVRRSNVVDELLELGADVVLVREDGLSRSAIAEAKSKRIRLGLNAVGGAGAQEIARMLTTSGFLVTYGAMAREPLTVSNGALIFNDTRFVGFWISAWYQSASIEDSALMFEDLLRLYTDSRFETQIEAVYPLEKFQEAMAHAARGRRQGKILLRMQ